MSTNKTRLNKLGPLLLGLLGFTGLSLVIGLLLRDVDVALLNPKGFIATEQFELFLLTSAVLLLIAVPTIFLFYFFAWKYRETNYKAEYDPHIRHGKVFLISLWAIPVAFMVVLTPIMWFATQRLEPQKTIAATTEPMTVQVIAMRWKWLFIYPEQNIATVNFVQIPEDVPIRFELTADESSMTSFWIPHLGGMLYAMTGHVNPLNLMADTPGDYPGSSAELNGAGFAGMKFTARVSTQQTYESWVDDVRQNSGVLNADGYDELLKPTENNKAVFYNLADPDLYSKVVMKYSGSHDNHDDIKAIEHAEHTGH